ncbi:acyltransferase [Escherichia coli]|uniref:acyltransferase family protein n=1 Tax=Escherichia coli TaxID=562 RepID=UPI00101E88FB|nr:acyltransferase [Escherichia coli]NUE22992.1 acyltransferase [Escherichia coli]NUE53803.1 acyltransferase [Escherichia coli]HCW2960545.1 acyltransferase [Escherichia coli]
MNNNAKRLQLLDISRFVAALMVVCFHYSFNGILNGKLASVSELPAISSITKYGYLGVELFFMISGYVILISARKGSPLAFAKSRAIRLYPAYWAAVIITFCFSLFLGGKLMSVDLKTFFVNFTMLQSFVGIGHVDGVYWTLVYEIKFYAIVFLALFFSKVLPIDRFIVGWAMIIDILSYSGLPTPSIFGGYYSYFVAGALLSIYASSKSYRALALVALSIYPCIKHTLSMAHDTSLSTGVALNSTVISSMIFVYFCLFLLQSKNSIKKINIPFSYRAGALTYPIYLLHAHIGYMIMSRYATNETHIIFIITMIAAVIITAYAINRIIEEFMKPVWASLFNAILTKPINFMEAVASSFSRKFVR